MTALRRILRLAPALVLAATVSVARGQVDPPTHTNVRSFLAGSFVLAEGAPTPEPGDQIVAFFGSRVIGVFTFTTTTAANRQFRFLVSGDVPSTSDNEGPRQGDRITFGFFDSSTDEVRRDVRGWNSRTNEVTSVRFEGAEVISIPGLPLDLTPTQAIDLILGVEAEPGDGGDGGGTGGGDPDVNGDGRISREDAAIVLRVVAGGGRGMSPALIAAADVNADGVVSTADAIAVYRAR